MRLYVELDKLQADERVRNRKFTVDHLIKAAQRIFQPYVLDIKQVVWWSVYEIGQRLTDKFDDVLGGVMMKLHCLQSSLLAMPATLTVPKPDKA